MRSLRHWFIMAPGRCSVQPDEFAYMRDFLRRHIGLNLDEHKTYLIESRVSQFLDEHAIISVNELIRRIRRNEQGELAYQVLDAMTTNETMFFRDHYPFAALQQLMFPELLRSRKPNEKIRLWSAAASTGQEAYSMAMCAVESLPDTKQASILGTDYSRQAVAMAREGVYTQMQVQRGLPADKRDRFFTQQGRYWEVAAQLKHMSHFQTANLIKDDVVTSARRFGPFDVVFCRNVLIYFTDAERSRVIDRIASCMRSGGYLITGAAETPAGGRSQWQAVMFQGKRLWQLE